MRPRVTDDQALAEVVRACTREPGHEWVQVDRRLQRLIERAAKKGLISRGFWGWRITDDGRRFVAAVPTLES